MYCHKATKSKLRRSGLRVSGPCGFSIDLSSDEHVAIKFDGVCRHDGPFVTEEGPRPAGVVLFGMPIALEHVDRTSFRILSGCAFWVDLTRATSRILPTVTVWFDGAVEAETGPRQPQGGKAA